MPNDNAKKVSEETAAPSDQKSDLAIHIRSHATNPTQNFLLYAKPNDTFLMLKNKYLAKAKLEKLRNKESGMHLFFTHNGEAAKLYRDDKTLAQLNIEDNDTIQAIGAFGRGWPNS